MNLTINDALKRGVEFHKKGNIQEADRFYTAILKVQPEHPDANHNLGVLAVGLGKIEQALPLFKKALDANPSVAQFWLSYIDGLIRLGKINDAMIVLNQANENDVRGDAFDQLKKQLNDSNSEDIHEPPHKKIEAILYLYYQGLFQLVLDQVTHLLQHFSRSVTLYNIKGAAHSCLGQFNIAIDNYKKAIEINPNYAETYYNMGNTLKEQGDFKAAIDSYKQAIEINPNHAETYYNMGNTLKEKGDFKAAIDSYKRVIEITPNYAEAYYNMGVTLNEQGDFKAAIDSYKQAIKMKPDYAEVYNNMGNTLKEQGDFKAAIDSYKQAIEIKPNYAEAYYNMGVTLKEQGGFKAAIDSYKQAVKRKPGYAEAYNNMGVTLKEQGDFKAAIDSYKQAVKSKPGYAEAYNNMGVTLKEQGDFTAAIDSYKEAIKRKPGYAEAYNNMGVALNEQGNFDAAIDSYKQAIKRKPEYAEAYYNAGNALRDQGNLEEAIDSYKEALKIKPDYADAFINRGNILRDVGKFEEALADYKQAIQLNPNNTNYHSNLLFCYNTNESRLTEEIAIATSQFAKVVSQNTTMRYFDWISPLNPKRLKIGFVSADLRNHPVGYFLEGFLRELDPNHLSLFAYSNQNIADELTKRIQPFFSGWYNISRLDDKKAADMIHSHGIHLLIDLSGHTGQNRLPLFAYKPAPVQATWLGYFATTGVQEIDYLIGDPHSTPYGTEADFTETIFRLPETRLCFTPPKEDVPVNRLPVLKTGQLTFGSFNKLYKITDEVVALWSRILHRIPNSRILIKAHQLNDPSVRNRTYRRFADCNITEDRIMLMGISPRKEYLQTYHQVDIGLDPFPFTGGTTSAESLWMGVPIITLEGNSLLSNQGVCINQNAGLAHWIAKDQSVYLEIADYYSKNLDALADLRINLRQRMLESPLCDTKRFAQHFKLMSWQMWKRHVLSLKNRT